MIRPAATSSALPHRDPKHIILLIIGACNDFRAMASSLVTLRSGHCEAGVLY